MREQGVEGFVADLPSAVTKTVMSISSSDAVKSDIAPLGSGYVLSAIFVLGAVNPASGGPQSVGFGKHQHTAHHFP